MLIRIYSDKGQVVHVTAVQAVVLTDDGVPVAYAANSGKNGLVYADARDKDWATTVRGLGLNPPETVKQ